MYDKFQKQKKHFDIPNSIKADQNSKPMFSTQKLGRWRTQARTNFESKQAYLKRSYGLLNRKNGNGF